MLDVGELNRRESADHDLRWAGDRCLPPAFDRCLLSFGVAGGDQAALREFDLVTGSFVEGGFSLPASMHVVAWLSRDAIVVGHDLAGARTTAALWPAEAYIWRRGTSLHASRKVFTAAPTDALFQVYPLGEGRVLLSQTVDFSTFVLHMIDGNGATTRLPLPQKLKLFGFQGATARHLFVQFAEAATTEGLQVPAESIVSYDFASEAPDRRRVAIVHTPAGGEVISSLGFAATRARVLFPVRAGMKMRLLGARHDGRQWRVATLESAEAGADIRVTGADPVGEEVAMLKEGFLSPPSIELLRENGSLAVLERSPHAFDASMHAVEARQARAPDGELIDYLLIAPKNRHGKPVPTLMTGYGAFGISLSPAYPTTPSAQFYGGATLELWFQRGGALVVPAIRGGGDRGAAWHRAAMGENRQRSYDDFIAVADDLVRLGITDRKRLGVFGASNGGLLAAVVALQRPDLFSAVVADAPLTDMLRFTQMGGGAAWTAEYGDPSDPRAAAWLARYSPLHNVRTGAGYPAFFITVAATDNRVGPGHARKLARRLADAKAEVFFLEAEAGGHDVSDPLLRPELMAMRATFLFDHLFQANDAPPVPDAATESFVDWARARAISLRAVDGKQDAIDVDTLRRVVGKARVVALGEPAHGAHEPLAFRNRLFQSLVEQLGFTAIALESGFSEARRANDFVMGGPGDAQDIARAALTWGFGAYGENVELLRWIRRYNENPARTSKVKFYGIDLSGGDRNGRFSNARVALQDALTYLFRVAHEASRPARSGAESFIEKFTHEGYVALSASEQAQSAAMIDDLIATFERERRSFVAASSADDYEWAYRNLIVARHIAQMFRVWPPGTPGDAPSPGLYKAVEARDAAMADNVQWVLEREGAAGRVLVFAHNAHVMNAPIRGGIWNAYPKPLTPAGQHLRAALGNDLLVIGTSSATNSAGLPTASGSPDSVGATLARVRLPQFTLDLREARHSPAAAAWLHQPQSMRANFTTELSLSPQDAFDVLLFIHRLTPAGSQERALTLDPSVRPQ